MAEGATMINKPVASLAEARRRAGYSQEQLAERLDVEASTVGRWERRRTTPQPWVRPRLAQALGLSLDELAEILSRQPVAPVGTQSPQDHPASMSPVDDVRAISVRSPVPRSIGWTEVEHVQITTRAVATSENLFGGGLSCPAAMGQLSWAAGLLEVRASSEVRKAMFNAVGNLANVLAYSAFDIADYDAAEHSFRFALWCADQSGSWSLRANTLAEMSRKATHLGQLDDAISLIEFAQVRTDRLTATARAMLWTLRANLLALTGRHSEAQTDVDRGDTEFAQQDQAADPPWLCYYDTAEHQGSTGKALIPVALALNQPEMSAHRLEAAVRLQSNMYPRSRTFSRIRLADVLMATADPHRAAEIGRQAVRDAASLRSRRIVAELRGLDRRSERHARLGDVAELRNDIAVLVRSAA
jgi:DNA-binding XRE family transcriptional regulator